jgi:heterodisulfide reductase subunit A2
MAEEQSTSNEQPTAAEQAAESGPGAEVTAGDEPAATAAQAAPEGKPRIGVYVCHCGGNISDIVDVESVVDVASHLENVVVARNNMFMCSDPGQSLIAKDIEEQHLDRVVVAACSPKLHETTFRAVLQRSGLNQYLYEHVNIREQVSWATDDHAQATTKATTLVAAAVAKAGRLWSLDPIRVDTTARVAVVGGGVAGLRAAADLARAGLQVEIIERSGVLGGNVAILEKLFPYEEGAADVVQRLVREALEQPKITIHTKAEVESAEGYVGNFTVKVRQAADGVTLVGGAEGAHAGEYRLFEGYVPANGSGTMKAAGEVGAVASSADAAAEAAAGEGDAAAAAASETVAEATPASPGRLLEIAAGAIVVASGYTHYEPAKGEYGFGRIPQVVTLPEFIKWLADVKQGKGLPEYDGKPVGSIGFIHCVGSRQVDGVNKPQADGKINEYCSRVCCTATLQALCELHEKRPDVATFDFYQDIRAYGRGHEEYYEKASKGDAVFLRYTGPEPPQVSKAKAGDKKPVLVKVKDGLTWGAEVEVPLDLVVLSVGMMPADVDAVRQGLKLSVGTDRFLLEVHPKLRPVELAVTGVLLAGASQGPKDVTEATASASAAAAKAVALLSQGHVDLDPFVAHVNAELCEGHGVCVVECPYPGAIEMHAYPDGRRRAVVNPALCAGCGVCVGACPSRAIDLAGWTLAQYDAMVDAIVQGSEVPAR